MIINPRRFISYKTPTSLFVTLFMILSSFLVIIGLTLNSININENSSIYNLVLTVSFFIFIWLACKANNEFKVLEILILNKGINTISFIHTLRSTLNFITIEHDFAVPKSIENDIIDSVINSENQINELTSKSIHDYVYFLIDNSLHMNISCGQHHSYRGVLSSSGGTLLRIYISFQNVLITKNLLTEDEAQAKISSIKEEIKYVG